MIIIEKKDILTILTTVDYAYDGPLRFILCSTNIKLKRIHYCNLNILIYNNETFYSPKYCGYVHE